MEDVEFIPLEKGVSENIKGLYLINEFGIIKRIKDGKIFSIVKNTHKGGDGYPKVYLTRSDNSRESYPIHRLIAFNFIPNDNPSEKSFVDHIDRNKQNFKKSNLRWVDSSNNMKNRKFNKKETNRLIFLKKDNNKNIIEVLYPKDIKDSCRQSIYESEKYDTTYLGYYWETIDLRLEIFYNKYGIPKIWRRISRFKKSEVYCSDNGLIKFKNSGGNFEKTPGHKNESGYLIFNCEKKGYRVHRLIYETFLNNDKILEPSIEIDHIDTNPENNSIENLRRCSSHKENINNPRTLENFGKSIYMFSSKGEHIKTFKSITDAYKFLGISIRSSMISKICSGKTEKLLFKSYFWSHNRDEKKIKEDIEKFIFQYDKNKNLINAFTKINKLFILCHIDTEELAPDGYYYFHGPHEFTDEEKRISRFVH